MTEGVVFVAGLKICGGAATDSFGWSGRGTPKRISINTQFTSGLVTHLPLLFSSTRSAEGFNADWITEGVVGSNLASFDMLPSGKSVLSGVNFFLLPFFFSSSSYCCTDNGCSF
jgi:hypothetical protein